MNTFITDSFTGWKTSHHLPEDYAHNVSFPEKGRGLALLSDGCSSTPHTDVVARLLVHSYTNEWLNQLNRTGLQVDPRCAVAASKTIMRNLGLSQNLDGTLLTIEYDSLAEKSKQLKVKMIGDGAVVYRYKDGSWTIYILDFFGSGNFPAYPWLLPLSESEIEGLMQINKIDQWKRLMTCHYSHANTEIGTGSYSDEVDIRKEHGRIFTVYSSAEDLSSVTVFSDGILSSNRGANPEVLLEATDFKVKNAKFLQRRLGRLEKDHVFNDDLSGASILFPEKK